MKKSKFMKERIKMKVMRIVVRVLVRCKDEDECLKIVESVKFDVLDGYEDVLDFVDSEKDDIEFVKEESEVIDEDGVLSGDLFCIG